MMVDSCVMSRQQRLDVDSSIIRMSFIFRSHSRNGRSGRSFEVISGTNDCMRQGVGCRSVRLALSMTSECCSTAVS